MGALGDKLGGAPADDSGSEDDLGYIGMPKGYVFTTPGTASKPTPGSAASFAMAEHNGGPQIRPPRYQTGAELEPRGYSPENIATLQQGLVSAGLIGPETKFRLGVWDSTSVSAYRSLLTYANQGGMSREEALTELMASPKVSGDGSGGNQARTYQTRTDVLQMQDPATLRAAAHAAFKDATGRGRKVDDKVIDRFVKSFQGQQIAAQRTVNRAQDSAESAYRSRLDTIDAGGDPGAGAISQEVQVAAPDMTSQADEFARAQAPAEAGAHDITKQFDTFLKLLGGVV